jgi:rod shape-determining protein MreD
MRWSIYFILAYITLGLQTGIARAMQVNSAGPNLVLLAVVFIAMNAPRDAALLGGFLLGALQDLTTQGTMGLYAFSCGLIAMFVNGARGLSRRDHPATQFSLTLGAGLMLAVVLAIHGWLRPAGAATTEAGIQLPAVRLAILPLFYSAIYSAILAPIVLGILQRMKRVFRFAGGRHSPWTASYSRR